MQVFVVRGAARWFPDSGGFTISTWKWLDFVPDSVELNDERHDEVVSYFNNRLVCNEILFDCLSDLDRAPLAQHLGYSPRMSFKPRPASLEQRVRAIIGRLPKTSEKLSHGSPTWWGGKRTFATFHDGHYHDGVPAVWIKAPPGAQEALIAAGPERFYRPKYLGPSGWVGVKLTDTTDWDEVEALLIQGHSLVV